MADEWRIKSLSQTIEDDEEEDLVPSTPGQDDIDITAAPSQDSASLLADPTGPGRRKVPHTLSLGLPEDPESESLPFLPLEWEPQFPVTPAQENGHSPVDRFLKGRVDSPPEDRDFDMALENCNGQGEPQPGCSTIWATRSASEVRGASSGNGSNTGGRESGSAEGGGGQQDAAKRGEAGGSMGGGEGGGWGGSGEGGNNGSDSERGRRTQGDHEEEESSHEPSSDSSDGVAGAGAARGAQHQQEAEGEHVGLPLEGGAASAGEGKGVDSQEDLFASQEAGSAQSVSHQPPVVEGSGLTLTPATTVPILQLSQEEEEEEGLASRVPQKILADTPSSSGPPAQLSPLKRKRSDSETPTSETDSSHIPPKLRKTEAAVTSFSSDSGEERVIVEYTALTRKDVEISPKQKRPPLRTPRPPPHASMVKALTFQSSSSGEEPPRVLGESEEESSGKELLPPARLPVDTEDEGSGKERTESGAETSELHTEAKADVKLAIRSIPMPVRMHASPEGESSSRDDSDVEIIEEDARNRSVEVVYEKPKEQLSLEGALTSQDLTLVLSTPTQPDPLFQEDPSQRSEPLLHLSESQSQSQGEKRDPVQGSIQATEMESICKPAILTQPDIASLITLPLESTRKKTGILPDATSPTEHTSTEMSQEGEKSRQNEAESTEREEAGRSFTTAEPPPEGSQLAVRLQLPDICTPSSQDCQRTQDSESMFVKVSKAARKRVHYDESKTEERQKEEKESNSEMITDLSLEPLEGEKEEGKVESLSSSSTPVSILTPSRSSQSTPVTSHPLGSSQNLSLLGSGRRDAPSGTSPAECEAQVLVEATDSEEEGPLHRKRKKLRLPPSKSHLEKRALQAAAAGREEAKTSTPNTSQGVSPNISKDGGSYIDKDSQGALSAAESSKSHNASPEGVAATKSPVKSPEPGPSATSDTQVMEEPGPSSLATYRDLVRAGYRENRVLQAVEFVHLVTREKVYLVKDGDLVGRAEVKGFHLDASSSSSSSSGSRRTSDISSISYTTSSSGYLGDKSSSSSNSSRRISTFSGTESSRLSVGSVVTLPSPPRPATGHREVTFAVPEADVRGRQVGKGDGDSPKEVEQISLDSPPPQRPPFSPPKALPPSDNSRSDSVLTTPGRRGRGRARGRSRGRGGSRGTPTRGTPKRGRGRGRGRAVTTSHSRHSDSSDSSEEAPGVEEDAPTGKEGPSSSSVAASSVSELVDSLPPGVWSMLQSSQAPLSEEEEEAFVGHSGVDSEQQLALIMRRVREKELEAGLLVFARFTDNNFYSAVLRERDGADRWHVQFTLDQYEASVREVYLVPTDLLPRGQVCYVRHQTEHYSDTGVVKGHIRVGSTILHIVETDRGVTQRVPHSHLLLTAPQAHHILQARLNFRSLVASPGREVSLDNIVAGRRRRQQQGRHFLSPRSKKADDNLDTSEATAGEGEDPPHLLSRSPGERRATRDTQRHNLSVLHEESDTEAEVTPRKRKVGTPRGHRTPRTPRSVAGSKERATPKTPIQERDRQLQDELSAQVAALHTPQASSATPLKKRGRPPGQTPNTPTQSKLQKLDDIPEDPRLGPLPPEGSQIFKGYTILMTSGDSSIRKHQSLDSENLPPFDKAYMATQIIRGGGEVLEKYSEAEIILAEQGSSLAGKAAQKGKKKGQSLTPAPTTLLLISNTHCRTAKYIQCLASGVPIVSFQWVINSCGENKSLPWKMFLLPAGERESGVVKEQSLTEDEGVSSGRRQLLGGERIFLGTSDNKDFCPLWQPLLDTAGAKVRVKPRSGNLNRVLDKSMTMVVGDASLPDEEQQRAVQLGLPIVSTEWVIQSLITSTKLALDPYLRLEGKGLPAQ